LTFSVVTSALPMMGSGGDEFLDLLLAVHDLND
jgi:hypothetical protein